jgi:hypothetical protein
MQHADQWILSTLYDANRNDIDTYRLYLALRRYIYDNRDFVGFIEQVSPTVMRFKPVTDVADDCFYGITMFEPHIAKRHRRRGAPSAEYYSRLGRNAFKSIGFPGIYKNWEFWIMYVKEHIVI